MSMTFIGPAGSCEFPWIQYALLHDNVLHHFKHKETADRFRELHRASEALGGRTVTVSAMRLREELSQAQALCTVPVEQLAISAETQAILSVQLAQRTDGLLELGGPGIRLPWTIAEPQSLGDIFGNLVAGLLDITCGAKESDLVEIIDC
jgi:hypothetical protein